MPYKKAYNKQTIKKGGSRTPMSVMGSQGKSVKIMPMHNMSKKTKRTKFPG